MDHKDITSNLKKSASNSKTEIVTIEVLYIRNSKSTPKKLTSLNLLLMNRLTRADLPTRTSPTRTTLHSCLTWVKRCLTLPILDGIWSTLNRILNQITAKFRDFTSQSLNNYWVPWCRQSSVIQGRCTAESVQFGVGLPPSTLARGWRSGLLSSRDRRL